MPPRVPTAFALAAGLALAGCFADTDRARYAPGDEGTTTFHNQSGATAWLDGCSAYGFERLAGDRFEPAFPAVVCVWEGFAQPVAHGESRSFELFAPDEPGTWRLRYPVGVGCRADAPLSEEHCLATSGIESPPFEVVELCEEGACGPQLGMPNVLCPDGVHVAGPTGRCLLDPESRRCGWEIASCPEEP